MSTQHSKPMPDGPFLNPESKPQLVSGEDGYHVCDAPNKVRTPARPTPEDALHDWTALTLGSDDYKPLRDELLAALHQAACGKGAARHANDLPFIEQRLFTGIQDHGVGFATGQAAKKLAESLGMSRDHAVHELRGAIVYAAAASIWRGK